MFKGIKIIFQWLSIRKNKWIIKQNNNKNKQFLRILRYVQYSIIFKRCFYWISFINLR